MTLEAVHRVALALVAAWFVIATVPLYWRRDEVTARAYRRICPPALVAILVMGASGDVVSWAFCAGCLVSWWTNHSDICRHGRRRRLRDAATGWVRRTGNRLRTVAAVGAR